MLSVLSGSVPESLLLKLSVVNSVILFSWMIFLVLIISRSLSVGQLKVSSSSSS